MMEKRSSWEGVGKEVGRRLEGHRKEVMQKSREQNTR